MSTEIILFLFIGLIASIIGAVPFGLVNLSVLQTAIQKGTKATMPIAFGASMVEVSYGILGIFTGSLIYKYLNQNPWFHVVTALVLISMGLVFLLKSAPFRMSHNHRMGGFFHGILLNLLSMQVLAYWIMSISFISSVYHQIVTPLAIILFLLGIWIGKMGVLISYASLGNKIVRCSERISQNNNHLIGFILIGFALYTIIKFFLL